jgi:hypothetical protein
MGARALLLLSSASPSPSHPPIVSDSALAGWKILAAFAFIVLGVLALRATLKSEKR